MKFLDHSFKGELIRKTGFESLTHLRKEIGRYINQFYSNVRLHSSLNYMSPIKYEQGLVKMAESVSGITKGVYFLWVTPTS